MAISAAFGMGVVGANHGASARRPTSLLGSPRPGAHLQPSRASRLAVAGIGSDVAAPASNDTAADDGSESANPPAEVSAAFTTPSGFHFKHPLVSSILQNDAMAKQCEFTLVSDAKASGLKVPGTPPKAGGRARTSNSPAIGGLRRLMKRAHTPAGLVTHYEDRLRAFLSLDAAQERPDDEGPDDWQVIDQEEAMFTPVGRDLLLEDDDIVVLNQALVAAQRQGAARPSPAIAAGVRHSLVAQWRIPDSFARLIVHTMCRYYGLVSFSETAEDGASVLHICHPHFFKDGEPVIAPDATFAQFLYSQ
ncbi:hypothetical protein EC988_004502 [Linderina pennispora]|nr:hypothetical protein EC988_004502 [Linderina pennispora]